MSNVAGTVGNESNTDEKVLDALRRSLPNPDDVRATLLNLRFFALCPDGRRVPVEDLCKEYEKDPRGLAYRTFENRLVLVVQAIFPDEIIYWQQAFYMSTGKNSGMPGTWLPFDGIVLQGMYYGSSRPSNAVPKAPTLAPMSFMLKGKNGKPFLFKFKEPPKPKPGDLKPRKELPGAAWFSKYPFADLRDGSSRAFSVESNR